MLPSVLIVDDEPSIVQSLSGLLSDEGYKVSTAVNGYDALKVVDSDSPDLVLLDIWMPGLDGIETLKEIKKYHPHTQVIIITGHGNVETAVKATKLGAFDLIEKPLSIDKIILTINNALNFRRLEEENKYLRKKTIERNSINGDSPKTMELKTNIAQAAPTDTWVLINGENGTGKELVARMIHHLSPRAEYPLIDVSCAAIPEELIESELFGHEKGAFTGAIRRKMGKFELADKGTIFLDEIGELPIDMQPKLLHVLQKGEFERIGSSKTIKTDVRVVASINKNLEKEIAKGNFRKDLYYRLHVFPLTIPPLRERKEDIPLLAGKFLQDYGSSAKNQNLEEETMGLLMEYDYPGNVRELRSIIQSAVNLAQGKPISSDFLPAHLKKRKSITTCLDRPISENIAPLAQIEKSHIIRAYKLMGRNKSQTARLLGIGLNTLRRKLKSYGMI